MPVGLVVVITSIHEPVFRIRKQGLCCSLLLGMPHVIERGTLNGLWIDRFLLSHQLGTWGTPIFLSAMDGYLSFRVCGYGGHLSWVSCYILLRFLSPGMATKSVWECMATMPGYDRL